MGLSSLDVDTTAEEAYAPGRGTASTEYEAAKRAAGIPTDSHPKPMSIGRAQGLRGLLGGPVYAARFRLDALAGELLDPLADLLGKHDYIFRGSRPSSLDCLVFGYISLLYYPALPQAWLKETIETKYPRVCKYIQRLRHQLLSDEVINPNDVWSVAAGTTDVGKAMLLPWQPRRQTIASRAIAGTREVFGNLPLLSSLFQKPTTVVSEQPSTSRRFMSELPSPLYVKALMCATSALALGFASYAIHHRRSPREGALIFWASRPSIGLGEAGSILSVLAHQIPRGTSLSQF